MSKVDYADLNPGIVETVRYLNDRGFETCDSGDGETHKYECDHPNPYVVVLSNESIGLTATADLVKEAVEALGIEFVVPSSTDTDSYPFIEASYSPVDKTGVVYVGNVRDADWYKPEESVDSSEPQ